ncbi:ABC transporter ATP-binding protein [Antribacter gilvus]|uniref:ABC transporter ATP-binding protein n=1 Tax=Antribacter gilvus TaxID=2304675 RepID=UPI000F7953D1|nr:ABC transporter ATP-binding protein [Antribacter gilvus]
MAATTSPPDALHLESLTRVFTPRGKAPVTALDGVDLRLPAGGVHGLLGPNGAGKTTLCKIACTVLLPTSGRASVLGFDVVRDAAEVRREIGIVFGGERGLYGRLSARENLEFWCAMHGLGRRETRTRVSALLDRLGLADRADSLVETFSRGMKQRVHLARGLVADPPLLLLDEPTVGMDPVSAHDFRALVGELRTEGRTVVLTTHDMAEAESVCDTVTFVDHGRVVGTGTPGDVRGLLARGSRIRVHDVADARALAGPLDLPGVLTTHDPARRTLDVDVEGGQDVVGQVMAAILAAGHTSVTAGPPSLEEVYLGLLGTDGDGNRRGMRVGS